MASDTVYLDTGVLRAYVDSKDHLHKKAFELVREYSSLHYTLITTALNISELSFWLNKSRSFKILASGDFKSFLTATKIQIWQIDSNCSEVTVYTWLDFVRSFNIPLDFADFYLYSTALQKKGDYIMTTDKEDFDKLLAFAPGHNFDSKILSRPHFTHDNIIFAVN